MARKVRSDFAAVVLRVSAEPGQVLVDGDEILVLESMKMEIPVLVDPGGVVVELMVRHGDAVAEGDVLAVLE